MFCTCFRERSFKGMDTSEETSDTCIDEHHENGSSGPPSGGAMDYYHHSSHPSMTPRSRRSRGQTHSPGKSPGNWRRQSSQDNDNAGGRSTVRKSKERSIGRSGIIEHPRSSRDSGINDQRESLSLSCSCNNETSW